MYMSFSESWTTLDCLGWFLGKGKSMAEELRKGNLGPYSHGFKDQEGILLAYDSKEP